MCEECGLVDGLTILRSVDDGSKYLIFRYEWAGYTWPNGEKIRLSEIPEEFDQNPDHTVIKLGRAFNDHNPLNTSPGNIRMLCQRCLAKHNGMQVAKTRRKNKDRAIGQQNMFDGGGTDHRD